MSSSDTDAWDDLQIPARTPSLTPLSTDSGSGEFNSFAYVGLSASGGSKRTLFFGEDDRDLCFGYVGSIGANKFCLKERLLGAKSCGILKHESSKFRPSPDEAYIRVTDVQALSTPVLNIESLSVDDRAILKQRRYTGSEWEQLFEEIGAGDEWPQWMGGNTKPVPPVHDDKNKPTLKVDTFDSEVFPALLSPLRSETLVGIFKNPPFLSVFSNTDEAIEEGSLSEENTLEHLQSHAREVVSKWTPTFGEIESSYLMIVDDLKKLHTFAGALCKHVGGIPGSLALPEISISKILGDTQNSIATHQTLNTARFDSITNSISSLMNDSGLLTVKLDSIKADALSFARRLSDIDVKLEAHGKRFNNIRPLLGKLRDLTVDSRTNDDTVDIHRFNELSQNLERLRVQVEQAIEATWDSSGPSTVGSKKTEELLRDTQARLKLLEQRVVGDGVSLGNTVFQSFEEMKAWVSTSLPKYRYGLFVDAGGLLDLFAFIGFTDFDKTTSAMSNVQKTGFATMYEARLAASMQNVFPSVFGKPATDGLDTSEYLPGVTDPDRWDNGHTGLAHQISRAMIDVEYQLESTINTVFDGYPAARELAKDCLYQSKRFVTDFCTFVSREVKAWLQRGFSKKEAWKVVCSCIRRIFEELHSARVIARDVRDMGDPAFTAAKFIWAVLKSHNVMMTYIKHHFHDHPSISAVMARHLAANFTKSDDSGTAAKITLLETKLKTAIARLDRMETKLDSGAVGKNKGKRSKDKEYDRDLSP